MTASVVPEDATSTPMWIVHTTVASADSNTSRIGMRNGDLTDGEFVEFSGSGKENVTKSVAESLIDHYDEIEAAGDDADGDDTATDTPADDGGDDNE